MRRSGCGWSPRCPAVRTGPGHTGSTGTDRRRGWLWSEDRRRRRGGRHPGITRSRPGWRRGGSGWNGYRSGTHSTTHDHRRRHHRADGPLCLWEDAGGRVRSHGMSIGGIPTRCQPSARTVGGSGQGPVPQGGRRGCGPQGGSGRCADGREAQVRPARRVRTAGGPPGGAGAVRRVGPDARGRRRARGGPAPRLPSAATGTAACDTVGETTNAPRRAAGRSSGTGRVVTRRARRGGHRRRRGPARCSRSRRASRRAPRGRSTRCGRRRPARRPRGPRALRGCTRR